MIRGVLALALLSHPAIAADLVLNVSSYHFDRSRDLNERNPGIGIRASDWNIGYYLNSHKHYSAYALRSYLRGDDVQYGVFAGGVTGYEYAAIVPSFGAQLLARYGDYGLNLMVVPSVPGVSDGFVGMQLIYRLPN